MKVLLTSFFFLACNFIQAQNDWDIQFSLNTYDCEANTACYTLELQSASAASWALGDQNYRLFFDGDLMTVTSVTSLLPGTLYGAANIDQNVKLSGQGQEAASPLDDIDDNLGFLDFNIVQTDKSNPASAVSIVTTGFTAVADICVDVAPAVFDDFSGNDCLAFYHSRPTTAGGITTQYTVLTENDVANNTIATEGIGYNDLTSADNSDACLGQLCTSEWDIKLTLGNVDCNANEACYIVELQSASAASWALGDQNYRFFFDGDLMTVTSVTSLLSGTLYGAANIDQNVKLSGQGQEAASPLDDIDDNLGFLDFSIVQTDKSNPVAAQQLLTTEYIQTAEICVAFNPTVLTDPTGTECISFYHSRPATAGQITTQYTVISENISPNNTAPTTAVTYDDVVDDCLEVVCASTTVAENDINQTPINTPVDGDVSTNDYDPEGDNQTVTSALADTDGDGVVDDNLPIGVSTTIYGTDDNNTVVEAGTITLNSDGTYSYTPAVDFTGDVPFAYTVTDDNANPTTDDATVTIEVIGSSIPGVNEPPVANDDTKTTEQDVNVGGNVLDNDSDPDGDVITVTSALADTDGDGLVDEPLTLGSPTPIYGEDETGSTVLAGTLTLNPDGTFTFDPEPSYLGEVPVDYTISDPAGLTDEARLTITIESDQGNATYANDDANVGPQDEVQTGNILTNDNDPEGDNQAVTGATDSGNTALVVDGVTANVLPSGGSLVIDTDGSYTYTPAPGFVGTEIVTYDIVDDGSPVATDVATLYLTTLPLNTTVAENDINQTPINTPVDGDVSTNDSDDQGDNQTVTSALADTDGDGVVDDNLPIGVSTTIYGTDDNNTVVEAGTITLNSDGTYSYTPAVDFTGDVPFAYTVTDDNANPTTDDATVTIEVIGSSIPGVNEPPVANDDTKTTEQDVNVGGNVLDNDSDPDGDVITVTSALADTDGDGLVDEPLTLGSPTPIYGEDESGATVLAGSLTLNPDGTFTFDPEPTYLGEVPVDYTISDPAGLTDEARLTITIESDQGNATYANDDANVGPQDEVQTGNILTNDNDPEGDNQAVTGATDSGNTALVVDGVTANVLPSGGTLVIDTDGSYTYTPAPGFVGTEIVTYDIVDDGSPVATDVATLYLTTLPLNTTVAENDINQTPINTPVDGDVSTNDSDDQGDNQTVTSALADTDGDGVVDDNLPIGVSTTIYGTDDNNTVVEAGTITLNSDGTYSYTPAVDFTGDVPFAYTVTDDNANPTTDDATVTIEVIGSSIPGVNEPPVANDDTKTTEQDVNVGGNVLDNDSDPDGDVITVTSALADTDGDGLVDEPLTLGSPTPIYGEDETGATVLAGSLTLNPDGTFTFDPEPTYLGEVPVDYTISDPAGLTDEPRLTITIESDQGNATYANDDANVGPQDEVQTGNILTNDNDPEGDNQAVTGATDSGNTALVVDGVTANVLPSGGSLVIDTDGSYTYTPAPGFVGTEIVTYDIVDDGSPVATDVATLYLTTLPLNCVTIEAYVYLEGSLITPQTGAYQTPMRTTLNTSKLLPGQYSENVFSGNIYTPTLGATGQAYNIDPWNYNGGEGSLYDSGSSSANADAGYPSTVTDWVLVSLRSDPSNGSEVLCQRAGLLHSDGRIEFLSNADCCNLDQDQDYYIVIEHRNHLIVMSHEAVPIVNGKIIYDFRDKQSYINDPFGAGIVIGQKEVLPGVFAMFAGNGDQTSGVNDDTDINASDYGVWLNNGPQNRTYNLIDYNMDGEVSALDFELWQTNSPRFTSVPRQ